MHWNAVFKRWRWTPLQASHLQQYIGSSPAQPSRYSTPGGGNEKERAWLDPCRIVEEFILRGEMTVWDGAVSPFARGQLYLLAWLSCRGRTGEGGSGYAPPPRREN